MTNYNILKLKQSYPLNMKVELTKQAIRDFVDVYGLDGVYIPFSGGKDSTVLLHICYEMYGNSIPAIFSNTKNEFNSIIQQVKDTNNWYGNVHTVMSDKSIADVIKVHGYPVVSKKTSRMIRDLQNPTEKNAATRKLYSTGIKQDGTKSNHFKLAEKHKYLIDAPFRISEKCCDELKKKPMKKYERETGRKPIIATMAVESKMRESSYLKHGCNNFTKGASTPMGFWTEQDVLQYIFENNIKIASVYGDIIFENGEYKTTGESRTGCVACILGMENERNLEKNRIQRLYDIEPKKYYYVVDTLGFKDVLEFMNYNYKVDDK